MAGALDGIRVLELAALGPVPFGGALLADLGADVVRLDRATPAGLHAGAPRRYDFYNRNKRSIALDLKSESGLATALQLTGKADVLLEGFRPGVAERLGLGPEPCLAQNARLIYGRMTGWGQNGPLALEAGHDINYLALTGALASIGCRDAPPSPPLNLVADLGGGAMYLVAGVLAALVEAQRTGLGQVIDAAMIDGVANMMSAFQAYRQLGLWSEQRESNIVDGGAPYYGTYETSDGMYIAVGAMEPQFYAALLDVLGLNGADLPAQNDRKGWPGLRLRFAAIIRTRTRDDWTATAAGRDACLSPVLSIDEAPQHPQMQARGNFQRFDDVLHPTPAPRMSRTPTSLRRPTPQPGQHSAEVLSDWGIS